jgi:hypothetical protein
METYWNVNLNTGTKPTISIDLSKVMRNHRAFLSMLNRFCRLKGLRPPRWEFPAEEAMASAAHFEEIVQAYDATPRLDDLQRYVRDFLAAAALDIRTAGEKFEADPRWKEMNRILQDVLSEVVGETERIQ